jgi:hypothetical protein
VHSRSTVLDPLLVFRQSLIEDVALTLDGEAERLDERSEETNRDAECD